MALPLAGLTVVALEQAVAAPFASRQLADLGARVIKIERDSGDFARAYDTAVHGQASYFVWLNRGKESVVLDLKKPADLDVLRALVKKADVLIQNLAPGAIDRLGLSPDRALELNPRLIYTSISGYGRGGPYEHKKAYDLLVQCEAGLLSITGSPEHPAKVGISIADIAAGMYAYSGILTALLQRASTGRGDVVEISMLEALGEWMSQPAYFATYGGAEPPRSGAHHASIAPYGPFPVRDGSVFLAVQNDREWVRFCELILDRPDLAGDERFVSNTQRVANREALHDVIVSALHDRSVEETQRLLDDAQIANARMRGVGDLATHPQLLERGRWHTIGTPEGTVRALQPPVGSREIDYALGDVPALGQHSASVRAEFCGITDTPLDGLRAQPNDLDTSE